jgi:hypothetical protein
MYVIIRSRGAYDSHWTCPTVFYLTKDQADKAAADANDFATRAGFIGDHPYRTLDSAILHGDDDGSDDSWNAHVAKHGGLPAADPDLCPSALCWTYGLNKYTVRHVAPGKVVS